ncbi:hypothetical protein OAM79_02480 [Litorivicinus sp.]|nr:hypothetical protein [Litorivicinus sp.]
MCYLCNLLVDQIDTIKTSLPLKKISEKYDESYVSNVDIALNNRLMTILSERFPDHSIVSEECVVESWDPENCIYIDPLDGTENFVSGLPFWGVGVAIFSDSKCIYSLIYLPDLRIKACLEGISGIRKPHIKSRIQGFSSNRQSYASHATASELRVTGCSMLNLCLVANGNFQTFSNLFGANCWDIMPGIQICLGHSVEKIYIDGAVYDGRPLNPRKKYTLFVES